MPASVALRGRGRDGGRCRGRIWGLEGRRALLGTASSLLWWLSRAQGRAMAGNVHVFRFVGFSSHRYTAKFGNSVNPVPLRFLADEPGSHRAQRLPTASYSTPVLHSRSLRLVGIEHQLWPHFLVKFIWRQIPKCHRRRLQCRSLFVCFLGALRDVWNLPVSKNRSGTT